jgi:hypothetical protein
MIDRDHIQAGNLPLIPGVVVDGIEESGTASRYTRNITLASA